MPARCSGYPMADGTGIEWTDATWNPIRGCRRVSAGCENCYAERVAARFSGPGMPYDGLAKNTPSGPRWTGEVRVVESALDQPLRWKRPRRIFVNSMSDLFHESLAFADVLRIFEVMEKAKQHTFQVLTKRPQRAFDFCATYGIGTVNPWPGNVWFGVSTENQATADERIPLALQVPAPVIFISAEPLVGSVVLRPSWVAGYDYSGGRAISAPRIAWVIAGGESGPGARPMHPAWVRSLRDQCAAANVPYFFKQWGEWAPTAAVAGGNLGGELRAGTVRQLRADGTEDGHFRAGDVYVRRVGKRAAGSLFDGREHKEFPR
jgi:protein gp37